MILDLYASNPPASDLLHDPFFLTIIGSVIAIIAAILGSALTIWYTGRQGRKEVVYTVVSDTPILSMEKEIGSQVEVHFNNQVVKDLRLIIAEVWNSGRVPIPPQEFTTPITFSLEQPTNVLDTEIVKKEPSSLQASLQRTPNSVILDPLLLNQNSKVRLKILVSGNEQLSVNSGILGVEIRNYSELIISRNRFYKLISNITLWLCFASFTISAILLLIFVPSRPAPPLPWFIGVTFIVGVICSLLYILFFILRATKK